MNLPAESLGGRGRFALLAAAAIFAMLALSAVAVRARAAEKIYWTNFGAGASESIGFANIDGSGGGALGLPAAVDPDAEQMAFDPADGRLYAAAFNTNQILWVNVDGSGAGVVDTHGVKVEGVVGVAVDPRTQTIYWSDLGETGSGIGWAQLEGSAGGTLNTTGATVSFPTFLALDNADGRLYWSNAGPGSSHFSWANLDGSGGGDLVLSEGPKAEDADGLAIDPSAGRLYWVDNGATEQIAWANLSGVGGGVVDTTGAAVAEPFGLAFDPASGRLYWGNFAEGGASAIGTTTLSGIGGSIAPTGAPVDGPQDPIVLKSPTGTGAPRVSQNVAALSCSQGDWSQDYQGSGVFSAPAGYGYQWLSNGQPISGATSSTYTATAGGSYSCEVTGKNQTGSASQTSSAVTVTAAALGATLQTKKLKAKAGKTAVVKLRLANGGQIASTPVTVCAAKLTKKAKKGLVAPKCAPVAALGSGGSAVATLKIQTKKSAKGTYKFTTEVKGGTPVAPVTVAVKVTAPKKHKKQQHKKK